MFVVACSMLCHLHAQAVIAADCSVVCGGGTCMCLSVFLHCLGVAVGGVHYLHSCSYMFICVYTCNECTLYSFMFCCLLLLLPCPLVFVLSNSF